MASGAINEWRRKAEPSVAREDRRAPLGGFVSTASLVRRWASTMSLCLCMYTDRMT